MKKNKNKNKKIKPLPPAVPLEFNEHYQEVYDRAYVVIQFGFDSIRSSLKACVPGDKKALRLCNKAESALGDLCTHLSQKWMAVKR